MKIVYDLIIRIFGEIITTGTSRAPKVNVKSYLKYSNIIIAFLQLCNLIFGSLDEINMKITNFENVNNSLKGLLIESYNEGGIKKTGDLVTPEYNVDMSTIPLEQAPTFKSRYF